jgi:protein phosphatase
MIGTKTMTDNLSITSAALTDRGLSEKRPVNEDSYLEMRQSGIFAVADGVGGAQAGEVASQMAVEILGEAFTNLQPGADAETAMRAAMSQANSAIFQMAHELPQLSQMATTIVALHLNGNIATIGHVGDSRLYRVDQNGEITRETDDHSVVGEEVRAGRMTEEQADNHPSKNIISRALGAESTVEPELKTIMVEPGTTFLLCSDGITRHINDDEIKGLLTFGGSPKDVCQFLKKLCYERGAEDNLTAVIVRVADVASKIDDAPVLQLDAEEPTVASARPAAAAISPNDDILELDLKDAPTAGLPTAATADELQEVFSVEPTSESTEAAELSANTLELDEEPTAQRSAAEPEIHKSFSGEDTVADYHPAEEAHSVQVAKIPAQQTRADSITMFGTSETVEHEERSNYFGMIATALGMLLLGGLIGFGLYYFMFAPQPQDTNTGQPTEMRSANIPLSAFEENRRTVDKNPTQALAQFGADPRDAEDYFLVGRANMLLGNYVEAKKAYTQSSALIATGDPEKVDAKNAKTLQMEIAIAMSAISGSTVQTVLKTELDAVNKPANTNTNVNVKTNR